MFGEQGQRHEQLCQTNLEIAMRVILFYLVTVKSIFIRNIKKNEIVDKNLVGLCQKFKFHARYLQRSLSLMRSLYDHNSIQRKQVELELGCLWDSFALS
jgi:hypothetical protein